MSTPYRYTTLPDVWPGRARSGPRRRSPYKRVTWAPVEHLLVSELRRVGAKDATIALDIRNPAYFRLDGGIRADARPVTPAVVVSFTNRDGVRLTFPCDTYGDWMHNIYAIAKTLEKLRLIDRDGVAQGDQQYVGFKALPPGAPANGRKELTTEGAAGILTLWSGLDTIAILAHKSVADVAGRMAKSKAHPDAGGDETDFVMVTEAIEVVEHHFASGGGVR